jgi:probable phosphoglycerate mutase
MRLLLVRHAESEWNALGRLQGQADPPLSHLGRQQAAQMAARLVDEPIDAVVASDLVRAQQTARALAETLEMDVEARVGLREVDLGSWTGIDRDHLIAEQPEAWRLWREQGVEGWEGGERYSEAIVRVADEIADIAAHHDGRTVVAVTHGGCVRLATCHLLGMPAGEFGRIASIGNSSITEFLVGPDGRGRLVRLNDIAHLLQPTATDDLEAR